VQTIGMLPNGSFCFLGDTGPGVEPLWGRAPLLRIAKQRGFKRAKVELARKLPLVLHRMWVDGTDFRWRKAAA
jgi:hypothetical protein